LKSGDRLQEPLAVAQRGVELFEIGLCQVRQDIGTNIVFLERLRITFQANISKPRRNIHGLRLHSNRISNSARLTDRSLLGQIEGPPGTIRGIDFDGGEVYGQRPITTS
jgi:hypothetical protein